MSHALAIDRRHQTRALNMFAAAASMLLASQALLTRVPEGDARLHVLLLLMAFCAVSADQALKAMRGSSRRAHPEPLATEADRPCTMRLLARIAAACIFVASANLMACIAHGAVVQGFASSMLLAAAVALNQRFQP